MILVIDANPFISGFLRNSTSRQVIISDKVILYSPEWLITEFENNESELMEKFPDSADFLETKKLLFKFIKLVPEQEYSMYLNEASKLTKHTHDIPYFAVALYLNCNIWSNEKSFEQQSKVNVYTTSELLKELGLK